MDFILETIPVRAKLFNITMTPMGAPTSLNIKCRFRDEQNVVWQFDFGSSDDFTVGGVKCDIASLFNAKWCLIDPLEPIPGAKVIKGNLLTLNDDDADEFTRKLTLQSRLYLLQRKSNLKYIKRDDGLIEVATSHPNCFVFHPWKMENL